MLEKKLDENNAPKELEEFEINEDIRKRKKIMAGLTVFYTALLISSFVFLSGNEQPNNYGPLKKQVIEQTDSSKYSVRVDSIKYRKEFNSDIYTKKLSKTNFFN